MNWFHTYIFLKNWNSMHSNLKISAKKFRGINLIVEILGVYF